MVVCCSSPQGRLHWCQPPQLLLYCSPTHGAPEAWTAKVPLPVTADTSCLTKTARAQLLESCPNDSSNWESLRPTEQMRFFPQVLMLWTPGSHHLVIPGVQSGLTLLLHKMHSAALPPKSHPSPSKLSIDTGTPPQVALRTELVPVAGPTLICRLQT